MLRVEVPEETSGHSSDQSSNGPTQQCVGNECGGRARLQHVAEPARALTTTARSGATSRVYQRQDMHWLWPAVEESSQWARWVPCARTTGERLDLRSEPLSHSRQLLRASTGKNNTQSLQR